VRYRVHKTRKHGINYDRYFAIRYQKDGKRKEEGLGWLSEGWTLDDAVLKLTGLKKGHTEGGATRLSEQREQVKKQKAHDEAKKEQLKKDALTFGNFFTDKYFPHAKANKKKGTYLREEQLFRLWISPVIGKKALKEISPLDLERIKRKMHKAERAPRSIHYTLAVIRQVFNFARIVNLFNDVNPATLVKKPTDDNKRTRFLTKDEADKLLKGLKERSNQLHDMSLLSLHCGLRAGEIFNLTWNDLDLDQGIITLRDTKSGKTRYAYMTNDVKNMFSGLEKKNQLVFPNRDGNKIIEASNAFGRCVNELGLNEGIEDNRDKVVFHTLRHTYASWLVQQGVGLYVVKERLGHSTITMTERYAHLAPENAQQTVKTIEKIFKKTSAEDATIVNLDDRKN